MYATGWLGEQIPAVLAVLADVTQNPAFHDYELVEARATYSSLLHEKLAKPEVQMGEAIHAAAYHNNTLGLPLYPTEAGVSKFTDKVLSEYFNELFIPQRMVVCAIGVDHAELVEQAKQNFSAQKGKEPTVQPPHYTGGEVRLHDTEQPLTHITLAFEGASWKSKDVYAMCALQMMMGGGGSFSAGGPGKGMCSRLYTNVLNQYGWVENAQSFDSIASDSGIFGINASCAQDQGAGLVDILCTEFAAMAKVGADELERAKAQLKVGLLMQLESRALYFEDAGRQLLTYNRVLSPEEVCASIDAVTVADVQRLATAMMKTKPAFAGCGDLRNVPRYEQVAKRFG